MINGLTTGSKYIQVTGGEPSNHISRSYDPGAHSQGDMMYDLNHQCMRVFDGTKWQTLHGSYANIEMTREAEELLDWARKKRDEEQRFAVLARSNPALKDAIEALQRAEEQVKIVAALVQE